MTILFNVDTNLRLLCMGHMIPALCPRYVKMLFNMIVTLTIAEFNLKRVLPRS